MDNYHLVFEDGQWKFEKQGSDRSIRNFDTKNERLNYGMDFMNSHGGSWKIHKQDNVIQEERTYPRSADPRKSKG